MLTPISRAEKTMQFVKAHGRVSAIGLLLRLNEGAGILIERRQFTKHLLKTSG